MNARFSAALVFVLAVAVFVGVLAARSQPSTAAVPTVVVQPTPLPTPSAFHIDIGPNPTGNPSARYVPSPYTIHVGQRVTWVNVDSVTHTATADKGTFNSGVLSPGQHYSWSPVKAGTYTYSDFVHPEMHGVITVLPPAPG
jgi:plastocyanin